MNISKINPTGAVEAYKSISKEVRTEKVNKTKMKDSLTLSKDAKIFQTALKEVAQSPQIRQEKVNEIAKRVKSGTYTIDSKGIAKKMIEGASFSKLV
ncbi:MAG: flagellar biosynthesis anti-sigma factor FlgM [Clostridiaceae bacterium]|nr:flagellar biosynthesis anti-sigma factor FlgM [Clostridiaceae bacterium]